MRTYIIKYINHDDDLCTVWLQAESSEDARNKVRADYHDIKDLLMVKESKY